MSILEQFTYASEQKYIYIPYFNTQKTCQYFLLGFFELIKQFLFAYEH